MQPYITITFIIGRDGEIWATGAAEDLRRFGQGETETEALVQLLYSIRGQEVSNVISNGGLFG